MKACSHIRRYRETDLHQAVKVFKDSIIEIGPEKYNSIQLEAWSSYPDDINEFNLILDEGVTYVAEAEDKIVSFGTLNPADHVEFLYTLKKYSKMGIASSIYHMLESHARLNGIHKIHTEASKIARPFFIKAGFEIVEKVIVIRNNIEFERYRMSKELSCHKPEGL